MMSSEYTEFAALLQQAADLFTKNITEPLIKTYWQALVDRPFADVGKRIWQHMRHGKFFPKPSELRPKLEQAPRLANDDPVSAKFEAAQIAHWDARLKADELEGKWALLDAYIGRTCVLYTRDHLFFAQRMQWANEVAACLSAGANPSPEAQAMHARVSSQLVQFTVSD